MRNKDVISYLRLWENIHNEAGSNKFMILPQKWIKNDNAASYIVFEFVNWLSVDILIEEKEKDNF
jgi:hypothetical protein